MQHLIVATRNARKTREIQRILGPRFAVRDLSDHPQIPETMESGKTFEENAILKAAAASKEESSRAYLRELSSNSRSVPPEDTFDSSSPDNGVNDRAVFLENADPLAGEDAGVLWLGLCGRGRLHRRAGERRI